MEKPKLRILYANVKHRKGIARTKTEEYHVIFKWDTPEQREKFKEDVKAWYYKLEGVIEWKENERPDENPEETIAKPVQKNKGGRPKKVVVS